ncbi:ABC transporter substrate-binding protein [Salinigranum halophilum]|uniref:ABC transporter substrate-binding protein n=1 Tax=Salinigranum halophilum TaxID=2565931 RepID=UPI001F254B40|nr:ABC transporter substrate-binding protein [Salinigranum halophilum]
MTVPKSGTYVSEGEAQLRGHELAVNHLNSGGGGVDLWDELSGDGVLGRTVTTVEGDTATDPTHARNEAARLINEGAIMLSGGSSSRVAVAVQRLCQQENVPFMTGIAHENRVTGADCARYGFREMPNTAMTSRALAVSLETELGSGRTMYQLYADYSWGREQSESIDRALTSRAGWTSHDTVAVPTGREDYTDALARIPTDEVDVLVLTLYGLDAATILPQVRALGLHEEVELVVPLFNRLLARVAGDAIGGVYGTVEWNWQLRNDFTIAFVDAFRRRYGRVPSYAAHLAYVQTLQFAAAAERAATFYPPEIIRELEGHTYDTGGLGSEQVLRECDHQAARSVLTVRGLSPDAQTRDRAFALIETTAWDQISYDCSASPAVNCSLGDVR